MKIAFLYEHPTWSEKLIDCFHNNDINLQLINIDELTFDTDNFDIDFDLLINGPCLSQQLKGSIV